MRPKEKLLSKKMLDDQRGKGGEKNTKEQEHFLLLLWSPKDPNVPGGVRQGEAVSSATCQPSENRVERSHLRTQLKPAWQVSNEVLVDKIGVQLDHWMSVRKRKERRVTTESSLPSAVTTKLSGTAIKAPSEATLDCISTSSESPSLITLGLQLDLKGDLHVWKLMFSKILLLPTNFSHLRYTWALDAEILEKFNLTRCSVCQQGFFYDFYYLTHWSLWAMQK